MTLLKSDLQAGYDRVAEHYARVLEKLKRKPFDCQMLDQLAESVSGAGVVCEWARPWLKCALSKDRGVDMCGVICP